MKQLLKELESGKHKSKGIEPPNMGSYEGSLKAVAKKNTHKPHKYKESGYAESQEIRG